jgi:serine/threonine-protein kinase
MPSPCPSRDVLSAYLVGRLQEDQLDRVADHLDGCSSCLDAMASLQTAPDDALAGLLRGRPAAVAVPDPLLDQLLSRAKSLRPGHPVPEAAPPPLPGGGQLGPYRLLEKIGQGGMGAVYRALHQRLEKVVALKVLPAASLHKAPDVARFEREMRAVGKLNHPNIVRATDAGEAAGVPFLVMDFVEGVDLHELVRREGPLPVAAACELVRQTAEGLQHAHEHGLVHRDIKPSNLLLSKWGEVKVLDLGLARFHTDQAAGDDLTGSGQTMGTLDYMAPEQAWDPRRADIRADIYSLGCTLYHLLAGRPPFATPEYRTPAQKLSAHANVGPASLRGLRADVPEALDVLVRQMLAKDPADRPATPRAVADALAPLAQPHDLMRRLDVSGPATPSAQADTQRSGLSRAETDAVKPRPRRSRSWMVAVAAAVVLLGVGIVAAAFLGPWGDDPNEEQAAPGADKPTPVASVDGPGTKPDAGPSRLPPTKAETPAKEAPPAGKATPPAKKADGQLAEQGVGLLKAHCYRCHGINFKVPRFNIMDRKGLLANRGKEDPAYVVAGKPEDSFIWQRAAVDNDMPPGRQKLSDAEKELLKRWIVAGAPFPGRPPRPFRSETDVLRAVREDLRKADPAERRFRRYFSLTHLSNNYQHVSADELRLYRAALAKVVNSLTWKATLVLPRAIDADETLFQVDLRDLGWDDPKLWKEIVKVYPYGLTHKNDAERQRRDLAGEVAELAGTDLAVLRADWFVATAARPPLYHLLLHLPDSAGELEAQLKVDVRQDFLNGRLARAGLLQSGVSRQNRLLDRHEALHGAYWKSYDFKSNEGPGNLLKFPLGPLFDDHPFPRHAFRHDGGEIIFNLPNGLQGYLLVNGNDRRIDAGPIEVVRDSQETAGSPAIVNGLSCMACHKLGVIRFEDKVRGGSAVGGDALDKVQTLFRTKAAMNLLLDRDEQRFVRALEVATGPYLKAGPDRDRSIRDFPEPVGAIARLYLKDLSVEEVALELGLEDPRKLQALIRANRELRRLGLGPLLDGGTISRAAWSSLQFTTSMFHNVARELGLGTPHVSF